MEDQREFSSHSPHVSTDPASAPCASGKNAFALPRHFTRPVELPFTADQRESTTIIFGHLTPKHERLVKAVFDGRGYRFQNLPLPSRSAFQVGREYCSNGLCNPSYFTAGTLIEFLERLEKEGMSRKEIVRDYVYFTLADCGPCRFGAYESEYRQALNNAGFTGFRVITFQSNKVISEGASEPGLKFNADIAFGCLTALILGDLLYHSVYHLRPYERVEGETNRAFDECLDWLADSLQLLEPFELLEFLPKWLSRHFDPQHQITKTLNSLGKYRRHLYGKGFRELLRACARRFDEIRLDRFRPKPIVKITGEFYSHLSEGYANYNMFEFLESEGAQVDVDTITGHLLYWLHKSMLDQLRRSGLRIPYPDARSWQLRRQLENRWSSSRRPLLLRFAGAQYRRHYARINRHLGGLDHDQVPQSEYVRCSQEFFNPSCRGGEGYQEVAKSIYYTKNHLCHMVLSLKPFGCMPSTQSDGVMAAVTSRYPDIVFVSVETSGDGDINAFSRVQMALSDAKKKADDEFDRALSEAGVPLETIREFVEDHEYLQKPGYKLPREGDFTSVAARFVAHVASLLNKPGRRTSS
ncbi:MAG: activator of (R)-2-hydroxyglutaryl-CoA dehydratase [Acidobacteriota bacterium]